MRYYIRSAQVAQFALDIIFVVDASRNIGSAIFAQATFFISQLIDYLEVDSGLIQVGACSYSANVVSSFSLNAHRTIVAVKSAVLSLSYSGGNANTAAALSFVRTTMLTSAAGYRSNVPNHIVILTDGPSTDPLAVRVSAMKRYPVSSCVHLSLKGTVITAKNAKYSLYTTLY